jgi:hypothetical protein
MHQSFRDGFEKTAGMTTKLADPSIGNVPPPTPTLSMNRGKRTFQMAGKAAKDFGGGVGIGKGIMPKVFGGLTLLDVTSKAKAARVKVPMQQNISESFYGKGAMQ